MWPQGRQSRFGSGFRGGETAPDVPCGPGSAMALAGATVMFGLLCVIAAMIERRRQARRPRRHRIVARLTPTRRNCRLIRPRHGRKRQSGGHADRGSGTHTDIRHGAGRGRREFHRRATDDDRRHRQFRRRQVDAAADDQPADRCQRRPASGRWPRRAGAQGRGTARVAGRLRDDIPAVQPCRAAGRGLERAARAFEPARHAGRGFQYLAARGYRPRG